MLIYPNPSINAILQNNNTPPNSKNKIKIITKNPQSSQIQQIIKELQQNDVKYTIKSDMQQLKDGSSPSNNQFYIVDVFGQQQQNIDDYFQPFPQTNYCYLSKTQANTVIQRVNQFVKKQNLNKEDMLANEKKISKNSIQGENYKFRCEMNTKISQILNLQKKKSFQIGTLDRILSNSKVGKSQQYKTGVRLKSVRKYITKNTGVEQSISQNKKRVLFILDEGIQCKKFQNYISKFKSSKNKNIIVIPSPQQYYFYCYQKDEGDNFLLIDPKVAYYQLQKIRNLKEVYLFGDDPQFTARLVKGNIAKAAFQESQMDQFLKQDHFDFQHDVAFVQPSRKGIKSKRQIQRSTSKQIPLSQKIQNLQSSQVKRSNQQNKQICKITTKASKRRSKSAYTTIIKKTLMKDYDLKQGKTNAQTEKALNNSEDKKLTGTQMLKKQSVQLAFSNEGEEILLKKTGGFNKRQSIQQKSLKPQDLNHQSNEFMAVKQNIEHPQRLITTRRDSYRPDLEISMNKPFFQMPQAIIYANQDLKYQNQRDEDDYVSGLVTFSGNTAQKYNKNSVQLPVLDHDLEKPIKLTINNVEKQSSSIINYHYYENISNHKKNTNIIIAPQFANSIQNYTPNSPVANKNQKTNPQQPQQIKPQNIQLNYVEPQIQVQSFNEQFQPQRLQPQLQYEQFNGQPQTKSYKHDENLQQAKLNRPLYRQPQEQSHEQSQTQSLQAKSYGQIYGPIQIQSPQRIELQPQGQYFYEQPPRQLSGLISFSPREYQEQDKGNKMNTYKQTKPVREEGIYIYRDGNRILFDESYYNKKIINGVTVYQTKPHQIYDQSLQNFPYHYPHNQVNRNVKLVRSVPENTQNMYKNIQYTQNYNPPQHYYKKQQTTQAQKRQQFVSTDGISDTNSPKRVPISSSQYIKPNSSPFEGSPNGSNPSQNEKKSLKIKSKINDRSPTNKKRLNSMESLPFSPKKQNHAKVYIDNAQNQRRSRNQYIVHDSLSPNSPLSNSGSSRYIPSILTALSQESKPRKTFTTLFLVNSSLSPQVISEIMAISAEDDTIQTFSSSSPQKIRELIRKGLQIFDYLMVFGRRGTDFDVFRQNFQSPRLFYIKQKKQALTSVVQGQVIILRNITDLESIITGITNSQYTKSKSLINIAYIYFKDHNPIIRNLVKMLKKQFLQCQTRRYFRIEDLPTHLPYKNQTILIISDEGQYRDIEAYCSNLENRNCKIFHICVTKLQKMYALNSKMVWLSERELHSERNVMEIIWWNMIKSGNF